MAVRKPKSPPVYEWQHKLDVARELLFSEPGKIEMATDAYVAFRYIESGVRLVFYPHLTRTTGNKHLRIRIEPCKNRERALDILDWFMANAEWNFNLHDDLGRELAAHRDAKRKARKALRQRTT